MLKWSSSAARKHETQASLVWLWVCYKHLAELENCFWWWAELPFPQLNPSFPDCPTLERMFPFPSAFTAQIFALGYLPCPFCQLKANVCTFEAVSSKVIFPTLSSFLLLFPDFLFVWQCIPTFKQLSQFYCCATRSSNSIPALQWNAPVFAFIKYCAFPVFDHSWVWSGIAPF